MAQSWPTWMYSFGLNRCHLRIVSMNSVKPVCQQDQAQNPSSVFLVIIKLELIVSLHCHVLRSDSCCSHSDIHQPSICSECKYSTIIQFGCVYLAHQSDGAVVSNLEWEKLAKVGTCGGQRQERSLKVYYLWTWIAWTLQTCCLLSSFDCFVSCKLPYTSKIRG